MPDRSGDVLGKGAMRFFSRSLVTAMIATMVAFGLVGAGSAGAAGQSKPTLGNPTYGQAGSWITDGSGRVAVMHGFNMVNKLPSRGYLPSAFGFDEDDARFLAGQGFNAVRLGIIWKGLEPEPGVYDEAYLNDIFKTYQQMRAHGVAVMLDFHQDLYNERFQGAGMPDWAVVGPAATEEPTPQNGFPTNYVFQDAVNHAFDAFWDNMEVPGTGRGVQDFYADAWAHVASRFSGEPGVAGYNLMNEPWQGSSLKSALLTTGCAATPDGCGIVEFEETKLAAFHKRVTKAIRKVDRDTMIWAAPTLAADFGAKSGATRLGPNTGFAFNAYCGQVNPAIGLIIAFAKDKPCSYTAGLSFDNANSVSRRTGQALFMTEFGANDDVPRFIDYLDAAEKNMVSWTHWAYTGYEPDGGNDISAVVLDPSQPLTGSNIKWDKLKVLARPYPIRTSGTPRGWSWDEGTSEFRFDYSRSRVGGGKPFAAGALTTVSVPAIQFPDGYRVRVTGARVSSKPNASRLKLVLCRGARKVSVTVGPGKTGFAARRCGRAR
jgi:endoglycosylceramidase